MGRTTWDIPVFLWDFVTRSTFLLDGLSINSIVLIKFMEEIGVTWQTRLGLSIVKICEVFIFTVGFTKSLMERKTAVDK